MGNIDYQSTSLEELDVVTVDAPTTEEVVVEVETAEETPMAVEATDVTEDTPAE